MHPVFLQEEEGVEEGGLAVRYLQELMHVCSFPLSKLCYTKVTVVVSSVSAV